ncbi:MAG: Tol-Pal system beta propeller repeat protein TolB [Burkholderiales bacterium]|jgi:TolB protein|nr:Tol-Pal system beta propeller repeat protein TolB [Burkholderiales bacterium]
MQRRTLLQALGTAGALSAVPPLARAQLRVEISGVGSQQFPIAIAPFVREGNPPQDVDAIVRADLARSGMFRLIDAGTAPLPDNPAPDLAAWRARGADALAMGTVARLADGNYDVRFRLFDTVATKQVEGLSYVVPAADLRTAAHKIADRIYERLTGVPGVFATRIVYVAQLSPTAFELQIADADGANPQAALRSREPIISPAWSWDGTRLAYVSFESRKPVVYVHTLATGQRRALANFQGSNSAPAWAPDGRTLAVALTLTGNTQIYLLDANGGNPSRVTRTAGIDTEPAFAPDGKTLYFTSDRGGGPQIYRVALPGGEPQRMTFNGDYNVSARPSPDGKLLTYVGRRDGRFRVQVLDLASGQETTVSDTTRDESPSFAPNGRQVLYATELGGRGVLATAAIDGRVRTRLAGPQGDVREPAWGPFLK